MILFGCLILVVDHFSHWFDRVVLAQRQTSRPDDCNESSKERTMADRSTCSTMPTRVQTTRQRSLDDFPSQLEKQKINHHDKNKRRKQIGLYPKRRVFLRSSVEMLFSIAWRLVGAFQYFFLPFPPFEFGLISRPDVPADRQDSRRRGSLQGDGHKKKQHQKQKKMKKEDEKDSCDCGRGVGLVQGSMKRRKRRKKRRRKKKKKTKEKKEGG